MWSSFPFETPWAKRAREYLAQDMWKHNLATLITESGKCNGMHTVADPHNGQKA
jgi:hypothetical protein